jgi:hypothetical protein
LIHGRLERPWLTKAGKVIVKRVHLDDRGFDTVVLETLEADTRNRWVRAAVRPVLATQREWYRANGELEMYQRDLEAFFRAKEDELRLDGWNHAEHVPVSWPGDVAEKDTVRAPVAGRIVLGGVALRLVIKEVPEGWVIELVRPSNGKRVSLAVIPHRVSVLRDDKKVHTSLGRVNQGWLVSGGDWLVIGYDLAPSIHADLRPGSGISYVRTKETMAALGLESEAGAGQAL